MCNNYNIFTPRCAFYSDASICRHLTTVFSLLSSSYQVLVFDKIYNYKALLNRTTIVFFNNLADGGGIEPLSSFPLLYATGLEDLCGDTAQNYYLFGSECRNRTCLIRLMRPPSSPEL